MTSGNKQRAMARFEEHMSANPLYRERQRSPLQDWRSMRIVCSEDDLFDRTFLGRIGIVKYFEYECGCGQSFPLDPDNQNKIEQSDSRGILE